MVCSICGIDKDIEEFRLYSKFSNSRRKYCKKCHSNLARASENKHPGRAAESRREWGKRNVERVRLASTRARYRAALAKGTFKLKITRFISVDEVPLKSKTSAVWVGGFRKACAGKTIENIR